MIIHTHGNLFHSNCEAIVNPVNCIGVMGAGLALQFKKHFPLNFILYSQACNKKLVNPGHVFITVTGLETPKYIINFPTKRHWRDNSQLNDIESGLIDLTKVIKSKAIQSIAIPPLGCGLGGLNWTTVRKSIEATLINCDATILIYNPKPC